MRYHPYAKRLAALERLRDRHEWGKDEWRRQAVLNLGPEHPDFGDCFFKYYLPSHVRDTEGWVEGAPFHREFQQLCFRSIGTGQRHVWEAFRNSGKSTIAALAAPLVALCLSGRAIDGHLPYRFKPRRYLWIVQDTVPKATQTMETILSECESNPRIQRDFPHLVPATGAKHNRPIANRDHDVLFELGIRLQAIGAGQKVRGRKNRQYRPDFVIVDDLEDEDSVLTKYRRDKLDRWLTNALIPALAVDRDRPIGDLHILGTPLHNDAVLRRLQARPGFHVHRYPAAVGWEKCGCWEDGRPLGATEDDLPGDPECPVCGGVGYVGEATWPYRSMAMLARQRMAMGSATGFGREYLLTVTDEGRKRFPARWFHHAKRPDAATQDATDGPRGVSVRIGVDPAIGEKKENDRSCVVVVMRRRGERQFHVDYAWGDRVRGATLAENVISVHQRYAAEGYAPVVVFEKVQAQAWGAQALEDKGIPVDAVLPSDIGGGDKYVRAEPVSILYENGQVTHAHELKDGAFEDELDQFPDGELDDYVDALVYAVRRLSDGDSSGGVAGAVENTLPAYKVDPKEKGYDPRFA